MRGYTALALHLSKLKGSPIENLRSREGMRVYVVYTEAQIMCLRQTRPLEIPRPAGGLP